MQEQGVSGDLLGHGRKQLQEACVRVDFTEQRCGEASTVGQEQAAGPRSSAEEFSPDLRLLCPLP